ncbi:MAG: preprotein translocase subunit YajC [Acidimicrobiia bacterium]|nr:preprotein translocase subunit YajC [Acidimicrobiia bacterium]MDX2467631.1 preprotein translocase subunit YajC [Acidimicrobiia bacterium]
MEALVPYHAILTGLLLATDETTDSSAGSLLGLLLPLVIFGGLFYVALILPQRRRQKQMKELRTSIEVGDQVRTIGGILGRVTHIDADEAIIDVGGGTKLSLTVRAIAEKLGDKPE